ncbi:MAG: hypothetical protein K8T20_09000 [Planctomycetes bacterium]|nr:hypothetical protein [Planctomycetota bacterium]
MKRLATALIAAALAAGCASDPKAEAAKDRESSKEEIRKVTEEVIAAMKENRPDAYYERLCRAQREAYPLEDMRKDWNDSKADMRQMAASMAVKTVAVDEANPNIASVLVSAPGHPQGTLLIEAIREEGIWRIREMRSK